MEQPSLPPPKLDLDPFTIFFLTDGLWRNDGGCMFGVVPRELWQRQHPADERNRIRLNLTCPLIVKGKTAILVDTGIGNRLSVAEREIFDHGEGWLVDGLSSLGMEPGDVTHVLLSHLHFDHCGGVVRRNNNSGAMEPAFSKARYLVQQGEFELARSTQNPRLKAAYHHVAECLQPIEKQTETLSGDTEIVPGVTAILTGGHTADHQIAVVRGARASLVHLADILPTRSHVKPAWNQSYDLDAVRTMEQKAHYLVEAAAKRWLISFAHDDQLFAARPSSSEGRIALERVIEVKAVPFA
jgi:glyoxylase-like metal-dependent hydrolase (beta-lactamase superfamily II)